MMSFAKPIIYVTRDIERALGIPVDTPGYFIIANETPFGKSVQNNHNNILLIQADGLLDTAKLLERAEVISFIDSIEDPSIAVFKPTTQIEKVCRDRSWKLLNPPATLSKNIEEKISQLDWLGDLCELMPKHIVTTCGELTESMIGRIAQFNHAHTGEGTILLDEESMRHLKNTFPNRDVKVSEFIKGAIYTNNNIVTDDNVIIGNVCTQITGLPPFTSEKYATVGNDWALGSELSVKMKLIYAITVQEIAKKMITSGYRGLFGIDMILSETDGLFYLLEINARQPASTTYESLLQSAKDRDGLNTFYAHLKTLAREEITRTLTTITHGAQIIVRNQDGIDTARLDEVISSLEKNSLRVIRYPNTKKNSELLRIQTSGRFMEDHDTLSTTGRIVAGKIAELFDGPTG